MKLSAVLALLALTACQDLSLGVGATVSEGNTSVSPTVSGRIGDVGVAVSG
jgi:hypothetical protein